MPNALQVKIELLDVPHREFKDLCHELNEQGDKFTEQNLVFVSYSQLQLCCIGDAGPAMCYPNPVSQEKLNRRERFLNMEPDEFKAATSYLKNEKMYDDVMHAIAYQNAPKWEDLTDCQKLWTKLTCLYNHVDNPNSRIEEIVEMFNQCAASPIGMLPVDVCRVYAAKLRGISKVYPGIVTDIMFREKIAEIAETVLQFIPIEEQRILKKEQFQGFTCTSDCFRVF